MKRAFNVICFILLAIVANGQAKYVFYFIGDGMGVNHVNGTEMYRAAIQDGKIGREPLCFTQFPATGMAYTFSATNPVTDSAAGGTALASGYKTYNGAIGMDDEKNPIPSVAHMAKKAGKKVGVTSSVSIDHATPAAFYAHQAKRSMYYEIAKDLITADFDFYGGAGFVKPNTSFDKKDAPSVYPMFTEAGYTLARGNNDYKSKASRAGKMIFIQDEDANPSCLPYAIDREDDDLTLAQITENAIDFLMKNNKKGFFLMVEGGKIDWSSHSNGAATTFEEVIDMDNAIQVAYEFYKKHPKETLIVVTADHETGGLSLGNNRYNMNLGALKHQECSLDELSNKMSQLRKDKENKVKWSEMKELLEDELGFWDDIELTWAQERELRDEFEHSFVENKVAFEESLYSKNEPLAARAKEVMNEIAMVGWAHGSHTAGYVPVYAIGAGSQLFNGVMDNTDVPKRIAKAAKY